MNIKRNGIDIIIERDYDINNKYIDEFLRDYSGAFKENKFTVPEILNSLIIAEKGGYQIVEDYYGTYWTYKHFKKGEEISPTFRHQYDLVTYGRKNNATMDKIIKELNNYAEKFFYRVELIGLNGELLDGLYGISFDKELEDMTQEEIIKELENYGVNIPETFYGKGESK